MRTLPDLALRSASACSSSARFLSRSSLAFSAARSFADRSLPWSSRPVTRKYPPTTNTNPATIDTQVLPRPSVGRVDLGRQLDQGRSPARRDRRGRRRRRRRRGRDRHLDRRARRRRDDLAGRLGGPEAARAAAAPRARSAAASGWASARSARRSDRARPGRADPRRRCGASSLASSRSSRTASSAPVPRLPRPGSPESPGSPASPGSPEAGAAIGAATAGDAAPAAVGLVTSTAPDRLARRSSMPSSPLTAGGDSSARGPGHLGRAGAVPAIVLEGLDEVLFAARSRWRTADVDRCRGRAGPGARPPAWC
jgi:hypothetical protein